MREPTYRPVPQTIVLGPEGSDGMWTLTFRDEETGERVTIELPPTQRAEMDAEFTGEVV